MRRQAAGGYCIIMRDVRLVSYCPFRTDSMKHFENPVATPRVTRAKPRDTIPARVIASWMSVAIYHGPDAISLTTK